MNDISFSSSKKESPNKFAQMLVVGGGLSLLGGLAGAHSAGRAKREAERKETDAREEMDRRLKAYEAVDISNPFENMTNRFANLQNQYADLENTMEDLTVDQRAADFQTQQFQQSQANILDNLRTVAGGSGIASVAQALSRQGQLASQQAAAGIGQQESANQRAAAATAGRLQEMQARGAETTALRAAQGAANVDQMRMAGQERAQGRELDRAGTMLGMSQAEVAAYMNQAQQAQQAKYNAISSSIGNITGMMGAAGGDFLMSDASKLFGKQTSVDKRNTAGPV